MPADRDAANRPGVEDDLCSGNRIGTDQFQRGTLGSSDTFLDQTGLERRKIISHHHGNGRSTGLKHHDRASAAKDGASDGLADEIGFSLARGQSDLRIGFFLFLAVDQCLGRRLDSVGSGFERYCNECAIGVADEMLAVDENRPGNCHSSDCGWPVNKQHRLSFRRCERLGCLSFRLCDRKPDRIGGIQEAFRRTSPEESAIESKWTGFLKIRISR